MKKKDSIDQKVILKLQTYLSQRPHSEYELTCKLRKFFCLQDIEKALVLARKNNWLPTPNDLSQQLIEELNKKQKGWRIIQSTLNQKKLPLLVKDETIEEQKARWWLSERLKPSSPFSPETVQKVYRFLINRGFEEDIIKKVVNEYQNNPHIIQHENNA